MSDLGSLKVGLRTLTYFYFNGVVENRSDSTHTETTYERGTNRAVSSYTDHRSNLIIREGAKVTLGLAAWFLYELYRRRKLVRAHADKAIEKCRA